MSSIYFNTVGTISVSDNANNCIIEFFKTRISIEFNGKKYFPKTSITVKPENVFITVLEMIQKDVGLHTMVLKDVYSNYYGSFITWSLLYKTEDILIEYVNASIQMFNNKIASHELAKGLFLSDPNYYKENKIYTDNGMFIIDNSYFKTNQSGIVYAEEFCKDFKKTEISP